jgi:hypothetical protein
MSDEVELRREVAKILGTPAQRAGSFDAPLA